MAIVKSKAEESRDFTAPENQAEVVEADMNELFGENLPAEEADTSGITELIGDEDKPKPESEPEAQSNEQESEELSKEEGEEAEEVPESGDTDSETTEETAETPEETPEETPDDRIEKLLKANELLMAKINDGSYISAEVEIAAPVETPSQVAQSQVQVPSRLVPVPDLKVTIEGITEEKFAEIQQDKDVFNSYIQDAVQRGVQSTHLQMNAAINQAMTVREQIGAFFKDPKNKDIMPLHNKVREEAFKLDASMPEASILEVLNKAGENIRTEYKPILDAMSIQKKEIIKTKKEAATESAKPKVPRFANTTGRREVAVSPKEMSAAEKDMLEMYGESTEEADSGQFVF